MSCRWRNPRSPPRFARPSPAARDSRARSLFPRPSPSTTLLRCAVVVAGMATSSSTDHGVGGYVSIWLRPPEQQATPGTAPGRAYYGGCGGKWALTVTLGTIAVASLLPDAARCVVASFIPLWAVLCAHYWFCLATRGSFRASDGFVVALSGIVGDLSAGGVAGRLPSPAGLLASTAVWAVVALSACAVAAPRALGALPSLAALRLVALVSLVGGWPYWVRATMGHLCGLCGLLAARFTEAQLRAGHVSSLVSPDGRLLAVRRRRTGSSPGLHGLAKGRRTSLPVLGQRQYYGPGYQVRRWCNECCALWHAAVSSTYSHRARKTMQCDGSLKR